MSEQPLPTHPQPSGTPAPFPAPLRLYLGLLLSLWGISAIPAFFHAPRLWSARMLWPIPPFNDFSVYFERMKSIHHPEFWIAPGMPWNYPAPSVFIYQFFYLFNRPASRPGHEVFFGFLAYLLFAAAVLLLASLALARPLLRRYPLRAVLPFVALSFLLCWPIYFGMQRGNIEVCLDAFLAVGLIAYIRRQWTLAACLIGIFGAAKLYPLLLLALFLPQRRWKHFALGLAAAAATTLIATSWIGPAPVVAGKVHGVLYGLNNFVATYSISNVDAGFEFDHSVFGLIKRFIEHTPGSIAFWAAAYAIFFGAGLLFVFFARTWHMPRPNRMLTVSVAAVLLPPTSFDYTLALLLPIWAWLVCLTASKHQVIRNQRVLLLAIPAFAVLFAPEDFFLVHGRIFAGQLKAVVLLGLLVLSLWQPIVEEPEQQAML